MIDGWYYVVGNLDKINFLDYITKEKPIDPVIISDRISR